MADLTVAAETCVALGATDHQFETFPGTDLKRSALCRRQSHIPFR